MQIIIAIIAVFGAVAVIIFLSTLAMNGGVNTAIVAIVVLIAVYSMARIQPKETKSEKNTGK
jgi:membrane protein implicated in regulation of membrane protease activity